MEGNLKTNEEILKIISEYVTSNPNQRFGQILFNLNINQFEIIWKHYECRILSIERYL